VWTVMIKQEELFSKEDMPKLQTIRKTAVHYTAPPRPQGRGRRAF
jgi:hypothetical protein